MAAPFASGALKTSLSDCWSSRLIISLRPFGHPIAPDGSAPDFLQGSAVLYPSAGPAFEYSSFLFGRGGINTNHVWLANNHLLFWRRPGFKKMTDTPADIVWEGELDTGFIGKDPADPLNMWWIERVLRGRAWGRDHNQRFYVRFWNPADYSWNYIGDYPTEETAKAAVVRLANQ